MDVKKAPRLKTYSAASGYVYEYYFLQSQPRRGLLGRVGTSFFFHVTSNRKKFVVIEVVVEERAARRWAKTHGRDLAPAELYAAAKMRLFRAFDETETPDELHSVRVSESNIEALLEPLHLDS